MFSCTNALSSLHLKMITEHKYSKLEAISFNYLNGDSEIPNV